MNNLDSAAICEGRPKLTALNSGIHWFVFFYLCRLSTYEDVLQDSEDQVVFLYPANFGEYSKLKRSGEFEINTFKHQREEE